MDKYVIDNLKIIEKVYESSFAGRGNSNGNDST